MYRIDTMFGDILNISPTLTHSRIPGALSRVTPPRCREEVDANDLCRFLALLKLKFSIKLWWESSVFTTQQWMKHMTWIKYQTFLYTYSMHLCQKNSHTLSDKKKFQTLSPKSHTQHHSPSLPLPKLFQLISGAFGNWDCCLTCRTQSYESLGVFLYHIAPLLVRTNPRQNLF